MPHYHDYLRAAEPTYDGFTGRSSHFIAVWGRQFLHQASSRLDASDNRIIT